MPEYLAPGVYVEETSFRSKSIEGVSTTTTGFIGPARYGPIELEPDIITGVGDFERVYGNGQQLAYTDGKQDNFLWHGVRAFFTEGGKRLYVVRVFKPAHSLVPGGKDEEAVYLPPPEKIAHDDRKQTGANYDDGHARKWLPNDPAAATDRDNSVLLRARFPGKAGNLKVEFTLEFGQNILGGTNSVPTLVAISENDIVWIGDVTSPVGSPPGPGTLYRATHDIPTDKWIFKSADSPPNELKNTELHPDDGDRVRVVTLAVTVMDEDERIWSDVPIDPAHERGGAKDSLTSFFAEKPANRGQARTLPITILAGTSFTEGLALLQTLLGLSSLNIADPEKKVTKSWFLAGGNDGIRPGSTEYEGKADLDKATKTGLKALEDIDDISIVAAPGATYGFENGYGTNARTINSLLIAHAKSMHYRIAVLDSGDQQTISLVRDMRAKMDSSYAALYYPWVRVLDPITRAEIHLPPSGFVTGIYARNDINRAVYKAPANEVVNLAIGFEQILNKAQQDVLNPEGVNCFRYFEGRGFRLWGARTISSDPEWKYVNLRRYFAYLEHSIDKGTQWAVFEPNAEALWGNVRRTIEDFLYDEWRSGALLGDKAERAYFVKCDRSTMSQGDLDNGRLICLIGVAAVKPAEFVIFRIGQWTADRKV